MKHEHYKVIRIIVGSKPIKLSEELIYVKIDEILLKCYEKFDKITEISDEVFKNLYRMFGKILISKCWSKIVLKDSTVEFVEKILRKFREDMGGGGGEDF